MRLLDTLTVSERALREIYLKPFELAIKQAKPWAIMTAYNKINGHHADSNEFLLKQVLRGEWKWDGLVMSDWGGTNSTADSLNAGVDLEMPGPTRWRKLENVLAAMKAGHITEETIDDRVRRVLGFLERLKCFENGNNTWREAEEQAVNKPEHQALIREVGAKGIVLLKNQDEILPLTRDKVKGKKIALFGYAKECLAHGGGSTSVNPHYRVTPWDALHEAFKHDNVEFAYSQGTSTLTGLTVIFVWYSCLPLQVLTHSGNFRSWLKMLSTWRETQASLITYTSQGIQTLSKLLTATKSPKFLFWMAIGLR